MLSLAIRRLLDWRFMGPNFVLLHTTPLTSVSRVVSVMFLGDNTKTCLKQELEISACKIH